VDYSCLWGYLGKKEISYEAPTAVATTGWSPTKNNFGKVRWAERSDAHRFDSDAVVIPVGISGVQTSLYADTSLGLYPTRQIISLP